MKKKFCWEEARWSSVAFRCPNMQSTSEATNVKIAPTTTPADVAGSRLQRTKETQGTYLDVGFYDFLIVANRFDKEGLVGVLVRAVLEDEVSSHTRRVRGVEHLK